MGTLNQEEDDFDGTVMGAGARGIFYRAKACLKEIESVAAGLVHGRKKIDRLRVDCFGFSRGAAAARFLLHLMLRSKIGLIANLRDGGIEVGAFEIPFVGLFDTGAHYFDNFENDTEEIHLDDIGEDHVMRVVQLAAGDENRYNFPLANIASAGARGKQYFLPGVHADVGGCYNNLSTVDQIEDLVLFEVPTGRINDEETIQLCRERCNAIRRELVELGWYPEEDITTIERDDSVVLLLYAFKYFAVVAKRRGISNTYSYLPLQIMADKAGKGETKLTFKLQEYSYERNSPLNDIQLAVEHYSHDDQFRLYNKWDKIRLLRRGFLHFSSHYTPRAVVLRPNQPQFHRAEAAGTENEWNNSDIDLMTERRRRRIFPG